MTDDRGFILTRDAPIEACSGGPCFDAMLFDGREELRKRGLDPGDYLEITDWSDDPLTGRRIAAVRWIRKAILA
jgi:hypothetical protein